MRFAARTQLVYPSVIYCVGIVACVTPMVLLMVLSDRSERLSCGSH
jgi:hypothetical protein